MKRFGIMFFAVVCLCSTAFSFTTPVPSSDLSTKVQLRIGGGYGTLGDDLEKLSPDDILRRGWQTFRDANGGDWRIHLDRRTGLPLLAQGVGIAGCAR